MVISVRIRGKPPGKFIPYSIDVNDYGIHGLVFQLKTEQKDAAGLWIGYVQIYGAGLFCGNLPGVF